MAEKTLEGSPLDSVIHFLFRLGKSSDFVAEQVRLLDQRREWFQIAGTGMDATRTPPAQPLQAKRPRWRSIAGVWSMPL